MDITKLSINDLKVIAYDTLVKIEMEQKNLQIVNQEIAKRAHPEETKEEVVEAERVEA